MFNALKKCCNWCSTLFFLHFGFLGGVQKTCHVMIKVTCQCHEYKGGFTHVYDNCH